MHEVPVGRWISSEQALADEVGMPWAQSIVGCRHPWKDYRAMMLLEGMQMLACVVYSRYMGHDIDMHVAAVPGRRWMTREYLHRCFEYPFVQLGVQRITAAVAASNEQALRFDRHLGFKDEGRMRQAAEDGSDLLILGMLRDECRFLRKQACH